MRKVGRVEQLGLGRYWGERRKGGGRKKDPRSGVSHLKREALKGRFPVHVDCFTSGPWFRGWRDYRDDRWMGPAGPVVEAKTWLLRTGWRRHGLSVLAE